jgi:hypothetical protein
MEVTDMTAIGGLLMLWILGITAATIAYYGALGVTLCIGLIYRRIRYGKDW